MAMDEQPKTEGFLIRAAVGEAQVALRLEVLIFGHIVEEVGQEKEVCLASHPGHLGGGTAKHDLGRSGGEVRIQRYPDPGKVRPQPRIAVVDRSRGDGLPFLSNREGVGAVVRRVGAYQPDPEAVRAGLADADRVGGRLVVLLGHRVVAGEHLHAAGQAAIPTFVMLPHLPGLARGHRFGLEPGEVGIVADRVQLRSGEQSDLVNLDSCAAMRPSDPDRQPPFCCRRPHRFAKPGQPLPTSLAVQSDGAESRQLLLALFVEKGQLHRGPFGGAESAHLEGWHCRPRKSARRQETGSCYPCGPILEWPTRTCRRPRRPPVPCWRSSCCRLPR